MGCAQLDQGLPDSALRPVQEFRKVFRPFACDLHAMNATHFAQCLKGQRMIIIGDSTMRQVFQSLACLLHEEIVDGYLVVRHTDVNTPILRLSILPRATTTPVFVSVTACREHI